VLTGPPDLAGQVAADAAEGRAPAHPTTQEATGRAATTDDRTTSAGLITGAGMAGPAAAGRAAIGVGPVKILLDDDQPTGPDEVADTVRAAREWGRRVAFHCVTRVQLVIALAALDAAGGALPGDRIEHAAVLPPDLVELVRAASLTVVTQPHFVAERGDAYLADVDPDDLPWLYRCAGLIAAGVPVAAGTDAPFGGADPWASMRAAVRRRTPSGQLLGPAEALPAARALGLYLGDAATAGGPPRRVAPGAPADLCLLDVPGRAVLADLDPGPAVLTVAAGRVIHRAR
ncbi:MAG: amidohydrolase family protein, partial [Frankia sp.]|nr:amidohydrolase family protein [Frankia sp.]